MLDSPLKYVLLTGSNLGNREQILASAQKAVNNRVGEVIAASSIHESEPWGFQSKNLFLNQALLIESVLSPLKMLDEIQAIESELGRLRQSQQWVSRIIDIDILCGEHTEIHSELLNIPHARLLEREFALRPLCEIAPTWKHPNFGKMYSEFLEELTVIDSTQLN